jgi:hypothetical protein
VTALSEHRGGLIAVGFATERSPRLGQDLASEVRLVPQELINAQQYRGLIASRVYPPPRDLDFRWFPPTSDRGVFVIDVPAQTEDLKPFMVRSMLDTDEVEQAHSVGFPRRDGDSVIWTPAELVHSRIQRGQLQEVFPVGGETSAPDPEAAVEEEATLAEGLLDGEDPPTYILQSYPSGRPDLFDMPRLDQIRVALSDPPSVRPAGFNLGGLSPANWSDDAIVAVGVSMAARVNNRGMFTVVFVADQDGLGWALNQRMPPDAPLRVNPLTATEQTLEYFRFLSAFVVPILDEADWSVVVQARRMKTRDVVFEARPLTGGIPLTLPFSDAPRAIHDDWKAAFMSSKEPEEDAYQALVRFYQLWQLPESRILYAQDGRISTELIGEA